MSSSRNQQKLARRKFILGGAGGVGLVGVVALARWAKVSGSKAEAPEENPFAYDLGRFRETDPGLIHYTEISRIKGLREDSRRIAFGPDDQLYLAAGNSVCALNSDGTCKMEIALESPPRCFALAKDGALYVGLRDHIELFDANGERRAVWDSPHKRAWLTGLAVGKDAVFAADAGQRVVLRYDRSGKLLGRIGEKNEGRNIPGFIVPSPYFDLELHPDGLLRVANPGRHRVEAYTVEGDLEFSWGRASAAPEGFCGCCNPINLALLADGRCVTCEKGLPRVKVYCQDGTLDSVVAGPESFPENLRISDGESSESVEGGLDAAVDSRGRIYILDWVANNIRIMTRKSEAGAAGVASSA
jgi:hypothetical protein